MLLLFCCSAFYPPFSWLTALLTFLQQSEEWVELLNPPWQLKIWLHFPLEDTARQSSHRCCAALSWTKPRETEQNHSNPLSLSILSQENSFLGIKQLAIEQSKAETALKSIWLSWIIKKQRLFWNVTLGTLLMQTNMVNNVFLVPLSQFHFKTVPIKRHKLILKIEEHNEI